MNLKENFPKKTKKLKFFEKFPKKCIICKFLKSQFNANFKNIN